jgi:hypothetical protein
MSKESLEPTPSPSADWGIARPEKPPRSTLYPAALSLGATLIVWGLVSSLIVTGFGVVLFAVSMAGWIKEIRHERRS